MSRPSTAVGDRTADSTGSAVGGFRRFAERAAGVLGSPWAFGVALLAVVSWFVLGGQHGYSPTWLATINTGTNIIVFLMVFLLQSTQMRDSTALHLKLDELLRAVQGARTALVGLEKLPDEALHELATELAEISQAEREERGHAITPLKEMEGGQSTAAIRAPGDERAQDVPAR
jgi:low affinity Fe/Cu permease